MGRRTLGGVVAILLVLTACGPSVPGTAGPSLDLIGAQIRQSTTSLVDPGFVDGAGEGEIDRLAATVITDIGEFWEEAYPATFGSRWEEPRGGFHSVDPSDPAAGPPPCLDAASQVEGNAYYCPGEDVIVWDRGALLPVLTERYGAGAMMMVLSHETGHAVQERSGIGRGRGGLYPPIVIEAMADCYAGAFIRWVLDGNAEHLRLPESELDASLRALITFRDPVGTDNRDSGAHGDAFDRVSAFQDGFDGGPAPCAEITAQNRQFTQRAFTSAEDEARGGNLELPALLDALSADLGPYFTEALGAKGSGWTAPPVEQVAGDPSCGPQGAAAYCRDENVVRVSTSGTVADIHARIGDYGAGTIVASRYALGALGAAALPLSGEQAQRGALCLAGSYTGSLLEPRRDFTVSPGDLDEAVLVLLGYDYPARDIDGGALSSGFDRVAAFRGGVVGGAAACGLG
ncbi:metalloprotease-like protein [Amycolatopsis antarctica]|uniref:metalloprotease-like protein n=1 Tax=Amycolatopsis antarctica TaxID=1854586 RepID=UPI001F0AFB74|nr:metalloprotease-like protein [Amycolatopsis antarctica]